MPGGRAELAARRRISKLAAAALLAALPVSAESGTVARPDPACAAAGTAEANQRFVDVQGVRLAYVRCGTGAPAIVLEMGFGGNLEPWERILPSLAGFAPAFAYSRPNRGRSTGRWVGDADGMRTSDEAARLLRDALEAAGVSPPYLLVGTSLGGLYVQKFAQLYPADTAGIVLIDNRPAGYERECRAAGVPQCAAGSASPSWSPSIRSTYLGIEQSEAAAPTPEQLGDIPVLVLTATRTDMDDAEPFFSGFVAAQTAFAGQLRRGRQHFVEGATHDSLIEAHAQQVVEQIARFWREIVGS